MNFLFQNEHFVAVDKPSGWLTTPARFGDKDPRPVLGLKLQQQLGQQVFPVHRLDFEVSGLVLYALSAKAHSEANTLFEHKKVQKTYQARSELKGVAKPSVGETFQWKSRILRGKKRAYESPQGKPSLTKATFLGEKNSFLHWTLQPVTGRSHQLRFDLSRHGFPIVGDVLYGANPGSAANQIDLRAVQIEFEEASFCERWKLPLKLKAEPLFSDFES